MCCKVFFSKDLVANFFEIIYLLIVNRNKNNAVIPQQIRRQPQPGIHHVQPVGVIPAHGVWISFGCLGRDFLVPGQRIGKVIIVHKVVACVVGRVYIDHLYPAEVGFLQQLQYLQIVALNVQVLGLIPIYTVLLNRAEGGGAALLRQTQAFAFTLPLKLILLKFVCDILAAQG